LPQLDRVYHSSKAVQELGWRPRWTFERVVERLARGESWKSDLTDRIGKKGYHGVPTGVYTTVARGAGTDGVAGI
ncbi:UNVERIFIED_CONTAM: NAD(P)-dependent oxidoreductase, partial [Bacteroidetes bacterium 56_B9]